MAYLSQIKLSDTTYDISAIKLKNARTIQTNLASTSTASFNGTANITPGVTGVLGAANGGTGKTTLKDACNAFINALSAGTSAPSDADYYVAQYAGGGTTTTTYHRRPVSALYSYIQNKTDSRYLKLSGGTMTGRLIINLTSDAEASAANSGSLLIGPPSGQHIAIDNNEIMSKANGTSTGILYLNNNGGKVQVGSGGLYGAVWNDYAEFRSANSIEPGRCIVEVGDDTLTLSTARLQRGCEIISDTFGFAIGETEKSKTPIAATGRVLCYLLEGREEAKSHIGWPVCSGPDGTVSIMTEEEEEKYPSRIIGTISAVPDYEEWGSGNVKVNGRIWIRIK